MFKKILIANRGEIAVRVVQACRELGIPSVALYEAADMGSLHVRLADECVRLESSHGFIDQQAILQIARKMGADAVHPGYGFLAEHPEFIQACDAAGIRFIGPPAEVVRSTRDKLGALRKARQAGFTTVEFSRESYCEEDCAKNPDASSLFSEAEYLGYPLVIKSCSGGRGLGEQLVRSADELKNAVYRAQAEAQIVFSDRKVYLEKAIFPAQQVSVQVLGDGSGRLIHLGECESLLKPGNQKLVSESPAPGLNQEQRESLWKTALSLARLFGYQNAGTVEFLVDREGRFYFTEIKARIHLEHPISEMVTQLDLVKEQIRIAAGEPLELDQSQVQIHGWSMICRINAEDPSKQYLPSPGNLKWVRFPSGPNVRVDTFVYSGCDVAGEYDPLIAKLTTWGIDRSDCLIRMRRALEEFKIIGATTNLSLLQHVLNTSGFSDGSYKAGISLKSVINSGTDSSLRDLAAAVAIIYMRRNLNLPASLPDRLLSGWHRSSRRIPH